MLNIKSSKLTKRNRLLPITVIQNMLVKSNGDELYQAYVNELTEKAYDRECERLYKLVDYVIRLINYYGDGIDVFIYDEKETEELNRMDALNDFYNTNMWDINGKNLSTEMDNTKIDDNEVRRIELSRRIKTYQGVDLIVKDIDDEEMIDYHGENPSSEELDRRLGY